MNRWRPVIQTVSVGVAGTVALWLTADPRPPIASIAIAWALTLCGVALILIGTGDRKFAALGAVGAFVIAGIVTHQFGGLAYLMSAFLVLFSFAPSNGRFHAGTVIRVLTLPAFVIFQLSLIGMGLLAAPVALAILGWATITAGPRVRHVYAFLAGLVAAQSVWMVLWLTGRREDMFQIVAVAAVWIATYLVLVRRSVRAA
jgi:hypothetical protein